MLLTKIKLDYNNESGKILSPGIAGTECFILCLQYCLFKFDSMTINLYTVNEYIFYVILNLVVNHQYTRHKLYLKKIVGPINDL